ncbi:hypothetical protein PRIPAC_86604 [Pristionchus pacificus]|uniref:Uncharacterized protein n=1 Tax=Pristionchus pacificus TaxID=54126 RepID=A0A2A6BT64_PRIPA|nr:hypothetical protein PRIPAC_86604 [Pristionchus pacificus]|eukprot:PDM69090.1 hypothetical protein PRIPAC_47392 [Pristionchus pacificus]
MRHYPNLTFILAIGHLMPDADLSGTCPYQPKFRPTLNCPYPGRCLEIISMLKDWLQIEMEVAVIPFETDHVWDYNRPGIDPSTNAIAMTQAGVVDTTCTFWQDDPNVTDVMYSNPVFMLELVFIVREQTDHGDVFATFDVFTPTVWAVCLLTFLVNALTFAVVSVAEQRLSGQGVTLRDVVDRVWNVIRMQLRMAVETPNRIARESTAGKILFVEFNVFQTFLLTSLYSGLLLSFLLYETSKLPFADGNEAVSLIASGRFKLVLLKENDATDRVRFSPLPMMEALRAALIVNPPTYVDSSEEAVSFIAAGTHVTMDFVDSNIWMEAKSQCNLLSIPSGLPRVPISFMLNSRASRLRKALNNAIAANTDFILRTFQKYFDPAFRPYSLKDNCTSEQLQPSSRLNLTKISGIFALLCVCLIGSSVAFITEMIVYLSRRVFGGKRRAVDETTIATMTDQKNREQSIDETSLTAEFVSEEEKRQKSVDETSLTTITASEKEKRMQSVDEGSISTVTTTEMGERAQSMDEASLSTITTTETEKEKNSINDVINKNLQSSNSRSTNAETEKKVQSVDEVNTTEE